MPSDAAIAMFWPTFTILIGSCTTPVATRTRCAKNGYADPGGNDENHTFDRQLGKENSDRHSDRRDVHRPLLMGVGTIPFGGADASTVGLDSIADRCPSGLTPKTWNW